MKRIEGRGVKAAVAMFGMCAVLEARRREGKGREGRGVTRVQAWRCACRSKGTGAGSRKGVW